MKSKKKIAEEKHARFLAKYSITPSKKRKKLKGNSEFFPDLTVSKSCAKLSNNIPSNGFKRQLDDYRWKRNVAEKQETIAEVERKKKRIAPYTNKGAYMYVTDEDDKRSLGRKV